MATARLQFVAPLKLKLLVNCPGDIRTAFSVAAREVPVFCKSRVSPAPGETLPANKVAGKPSSENASSFAVDAVAGPAEGTALCP